MLNKWLQQTFEQWLKQRMPSAKQQQLSNKNIFILPTRFGFTYLLFMLVVFVLGTNYQNNIILLISYLMASFFLTIMLHSFFNLSGLTFACYGESSGYAEQVINLNLTVITNKPRFDLTCAFVGQAACHVLMVAKGQTHLRVPYYATQRGVIDPGRVKVSSEYSFGLFVCWTKLDFACQILVYPKPRAIKHLLTHHFVKESNDQGGKQKVKGNEDFDELQQHKVGEPLSKIAWKQLARGQGWLSKAYAQEQGNTPWLRLQDMPSREQETQLQMLCYLIMEYHKRAQCYGVEIGNISYVPAMDSAHLQTCLQALAYYPHHQAYS